ncbi:hypothetical protein EVAR_11370_1 [Eumeta japonica]|uniref:Uncharacterized protein n=1 Tax=Eumeta variegata TaxID=151549 RepID=A0A4C1U166_EUMVA|nr:hypothetical protein EVAR_11370_1 [Eumeta japonica]
MYKTSDPNGVSEVMIKGRCTPSICADADASRHAVIGLAGTLSVRRRHRKIVTESALRVRESATRWGLNQHLCTCIPSDRA